MPKVSKEAKRNLTSRGDVHELIEMADKAFRYIYANMATKEDLRQMETRRQRDRKQDKQEIIKEFDRKREEDKKEILDGVKARMEVREELLQEAHEVELSYVEGKKIAPTPWKSIPRRLKSLEFDMNKVKDHLEIS